MTVPDDAYDRVRVTLDRMLDGNREALLACIADLGEDVARASKVSSETTLLGLLKHGAAVERLWFQQRLASLPAPEHDGSTDSEGAWTLSPDDTVASVAADFGRACERSREIARTRALHDGYTDPAHGFVSVRWILAHLIEEHARHAGHADILRELLGGEATY
ncbi:MAG: DinB family protein [Nocardioides sp.]